MDSATTLNQHKTFSNCSFILEVHLDRSVEWGYLHWGFAIDSSHYTFFSPLVFEIATQEFAIDH